MIKQSRYAFDETVTRVLRAILDAGNTIFATIDQAAAAKSVGMTLRPTTLIIFGNPKGGTPLMDAFALFALELPLKLLVWEQDGVVNIAAADMAEAAKRYGVTGKDAVIAAMDKALEAVGASAQASPVTS